MKKIFALLLLASALGVSADTNEVENLYLGITKRNAFELTESKPVPILPPAASILSPSVFLTGITRLNGVRKVHLVLKESDGSNKYVSLAADQKLYNIELNKILNDSVKITNNGAPMLLSFEKNRLPATITKPAAKPAPKPPEKLSSPKKVPSRKSRSEDIIKYLEKYRKDGRK